MINPFDPATAPVEEPQSVVQGSFVHWRRPLGTYDSSIYAYQYTAKLLGDKGTKQHIVDVSSVGYVSFTIDWPAGRYEWILYMVRIADGARSPVARGFFKIIPDTSSAVDRRSHAAIMVDKIESLLENRADADVASYTIANRQINKMTVAELQKWREYYVAELAKEEGETALRAGRLNNRNKVRVRFI